MPAQQRLFTVLSPHGPFLPLCWRQVWHLRRRCILPDPGLLAGGALQKLQCPRALHITPCYHPLMWFQVEADLTCLLSARIYPNLLTDASYRRFLTLAGLPAGGQPGGLTPPALRANFDKAAKISAGLAVAAVSKSGGIEEISACAKLLKPPIVLCHDGTARELHAWRASARSRSSHRVRVSRVAFLLPAERCS